MYKKTFLTLTILLTLSSFLHSEDIRLFVPNEQQDNIDLSFNSMSQDSLNKLASDLNLKNAEVLKQADEELSVKLTTYKNCTDGCKVPLLKLDKIGIANNASKTLLISKNSIEVSSVSNFKNTKILKQADVELSVKSIMHKYSYRGYKNEPLFTLAEIGITNNTGKTLLINKNSIEVPFVNPEKILQENKSNPAVGIIFTTAISAIFYVGSLAVIGSYLFNLYNGSVGNGSSELGFIGAISFSAIYGTAFGALSRHMFLMSKETNKRIETELKVMLENLNQTIKIQDKSSRLVYVPVEACTTNIRFTLYDEDDSAYTTFDASLLKE